MNKTLQAKKLLTKAQLMQSVIHTSNDNKPNSTLLSDSRFIRSELNTRQVSRMPETQSARMQASELVLSYKPQSTLSLKIKASNACTLTLA